MINFSVVLPTAITTWMEGGTNTTSFYDLATNEAFWQLEDLAGYDYKCQNLPKANRGFEESYNPTKLEPTKGLLPRVLH